MSQRADYSHTSDCSSFEIANPCLCIHSNTVSTQTFRVCRKDRVREARASIRVDNSLRAFARLWAILRPWALPARSQIRLRLRGEFRTQTRNADKRTKSADKKPRLAPGLFVVRC